MVRHATVIIATFFVFSCNLCALAGTLQQKVAETIVSVAPVSPGTFLDFQCGRKCLIHGKGFTEVVQVRMFQGSPEYLAGLSDDPQFRGPGCVELTSTVTIIESMTAGEPKGTAAVDLHFYFTRQWLRRLKNGLVDGEYAFVFEVLPKSAAPSPGKFHDENLFISTAQLHEYFSHAILVTIHAPTYQKVAMPRKHKPTGRRVATIPSPPPATPRATHDVNCGRVTFVTPVVIEARRDSSGSQKTAQTHVPTRSRRNTVLTEQPRR
jgi:hypothetical protein